MGDKKAGIPVLLIDRSVDPSLAKAGQDYLAFVGSNFIQEGQRVAEWTIKKTDGKGKIIELEGTTGSSPANDRKKGFDDAIKAASGLVLLASQSGDFARDKGRQVAETLLQAHPDATIVYAHNDEMALGAIAAIEAAGKAPGKDVLVVSIDGEKDAVQAVVDGKLGATLMQTSSGPKPSTSCAPNTPPARRYRRSSSIRTGSSTRATPRRCWRPHSEGRFCRSSSR